MDFEQIIKRLDWLDEERRKDKQTIAVLEERLAALQSELKVAAKKVKELDAALSEVSAAPARLAQLEAVLNQQKADLAKAIAASEKRQAEQQKEAEKRLALQIGALEKTLAELAALKDSVAEIRRGVKGWNEEDARRSRLMKDWETKIKETIEALESTQQTIRAAEEARRQDAKRVTDLQGELGALRKRLDEAREKVELFNDSIRRVESRVNEVVASETERRQAHVAFLETQARLQIERDQAWKEWESHLDSLRKQTQSLDIQLQQWDAAQRAVKRAQETYEEITQKFERRINEITEMQRLAEDRFRQEWVTFKADEQKRWTGFTLSQDEIRKDMHAEIEKLEQRLTALDDLAQTHQDVLQQTKEANEQLLQAILAQIHELLSAYDRIMGSLK
ncbi:MAG: hypothetical protein ABWK53_04560 [Anaerolineales bacterium]